MGRPRKSVIPPAVDTVNMTREEMINHFAGRINPESDHEDRMAGSQEERRARIEAKLEKKAAARRERNGHKGGRPKGSVTKKMEDFEKWARKMEPGVVYTLPDKNLNASSVKRRLLEMMRKDPEWIYTSFYEGGKNIEKFPTKVPHFFILKTSVAAMEDK